jgi:rhamnosyl/mannosyltransferase
VDEAVKVLHLYKDYYPILGGIENHVRALAEGQARRGLNVTVLTTSTSGKTIVEWQDGIRVVKAGRIATVASTPISWKLIAWLWRLEADLVHLQFPYPWGEMAYLLAGRKRPLIITYQSDVVRQARLLRLYRPLLWRVLGRAKWLIATSQRYLETSPYLGRFKDRCQVIPLGIDHGRFSKPRPDQAEAIRGRFRKPLLLFVGRLRYYKGLQYLITAMNELDAVLLVIGSGQMEVPWKSLARELNVEKKVFFLGDVPDSELPGYYQAADVFVLPSTHRSEAYGVSLLEAMASGLPVVSTELGTGTSFVNQHGRTGLVVPAGDSLALARALHELLGDDARRRALGQCASERVEKEFSLEAMVDRVIELYQRTLQG